MHLFIHTALTLREPQEIKIQRFELLARLDSVSIAATTIDDVEMWTLVKEDQQMNYQHIPIMPIRHDLRQRGDPVEGWLHFSLDLRESAILKSTLLLKVITACGTCIGETKGAYAFPDAKGKGRMWRKETLKL